MSHFVCLLSFPSDGIQQHFLSFSVNIHLLRCQSKGFHSKMLHSSCQAELLIFINQLTFSFQTGQKNYHDIQAKPIRQTSPHSSLKLNIYVNINPKALYCTHSLSGAVTLKKHSGVLMTFYRRFQRGPFKNAVRYYNINSAFVSKHPLAPAVLCSP